LCCSSLAGGELYGPLNDFFVAVTLALLVPPAIALLRISGTGVVWFRVVTWLAVAGIALAATGQLLLTAKAISLETSFVTGSIGILPVIAWGIAQAYLGVRLGIPSRAVGWAVAAALVLSALVTITWSFGADAATWILGAALVVCLAGYLGMLGRNLMARA